MAERAAWDHFSGADGGPAAVPVAIAGIVLFGVALSFRRLAPVLVLVGLLAGLGAGIVFWMDWSSDVSTLTHARPSTWEADVYRDPARTMFGTRTSASMHAEDGTTRRLSVSFSKNHAAPEAGSSLRLTGSYKAPSLDEFGRRDHKSGMVGRVSVRAAETPRPTGSLRGLIMPWRSAALERIRKFAGSGAGIVSGVVLGDTRLLADTQAETDFRTTGLSHLIAISGGHLVVVASLLNIVLTSARTSVPLRNFAVAATMGLYVVASGVQASAIRAWLMALIVIAARQLGRRSDALAALSLAMIITLLVWPPAAFDLGFQLSVAAVAGLLVFARFAEHWLGHEIPKAAKHAFSAASLTFVSQAATAPLTIGVFGVMSLISPVANVVVAPVVTAILVTGLAGVCLSGPLASMGNIGIRIAGMFADVAQWLAGGLASVPYAAIPLGTDGRLVTLVAVVAFGLLWAIWPQPTRVRVRWLYGMLVLGVLLLGAGPLPIGGASIIVLDVGQGDAIIVRDGPHVLLVDTGPEPSALRAALSRNGVRRLEGVLVTHGHDDHYGGLDALEGVIPADVGYVVSGATSTKGRWLDEIEAVTKSIKELGLGESIIVGSFNVTVLSPAVPPADPTQNEASLILLVERKDFSALITGDAEAPELHTAIRDGQLRDIDVLKVGHHASADAVDAQSMSTMRPEVSLISVGEGNRFGHPVGSTLDMLAQFGSRVLRTDQSGDLTVRVSSDGYSVTASHH